MSVLDTNIKINYYFEEISKIPRGSFNEKGISNYLVNFAKEHNLRYVQDSYNNVVIYKDAYPGYEDHPAIILQGHMDMVAEKEIDCDHDFLNDPLDLYIKDGFLRAKGTTLGADDGVGVCYMLALLDNKNLKHPPLECVFTVQEEVGMLGASHLDASLLTGKRYINIDVEGEGTVFVSSSGSGDFIVSKKMDQESNTMPCYKLSVKGLKGGHSGEEINTHRGNAIKQCIRILFYLMQDGINICLVDFTGGTKRNAIPRECSITFTADSDNVEELVLKYFSMLKHEFVEKEPDMWFDIKTVESDHRYTHIQSHELISYLYMCMNGCIRLSQEFNQLPLLSLNLSTLENHNDTAVINHLVRSPSKELRQNMYTNLLSLASIYTLESMIKNDHDGWDYEKDSKLRQSFTEFYKAKTGKEAILNATHSGLETGIFKSKIPDLDIITLGCNLYDIHSPDERLDTASYLRTYKLLKDFLETL